MKIDKNVKKFAEVQKLLLSLFTIVQACSDFIQRYSYSVFSLLKSI